MSHTNVPHFSVLNCTHLQRNERVYKNRFLKTPLFSRHLRRFVHISYSIVRDCPKQKVCLPFRQITSKDGPFRPVFIFTPHFAPHFSTFARYSHWASKGKIQLNGGVLVGIDRDEVINVILQGSNAHGRCLAFRIGSQIV